MTRGLAQYITTIKYDFILDSRVVVSAVHPLKTGSPKLTVQLHSTL